MNSQARSRGLVIVELIEQAKAGSKEAAGELLEHFRPLMLQIANDEQYRRIKSKVGASDLVQLTCLEMSRSIGNFRGHNARQLTSWLIEILRANVADQHRFFAGSKRNIYRESGSQRDSRTHEFWNQQVDPLGDSCSPPSQAMNNETSAMIESAINMLPDVSRQVVMLRSQERLSFAEIGLRINRTAEATRKIWSRAIESLRDSNSDAGVRIVDLR